MLTSCMREVEGIAADALYTLPERQETLEWPCTSAFTQWLPPPPSSNAVTQPELSVMVTFNYKHQVIDSK